MICSRFFDKVKKSPINYFSDLFISAMVIFWIVDNVYQSIIASVVTVSSVILSYQTSMNCFDTSMWSSIGTNVAIPLSCGGAIWMIKNAIQHAISNSKGQQAKEDFPAAHPDGEYEEIDLENEDTDADISEDEPILVNTTKRRKIHDFFRDFFDRIVNRFNTNRNGNRSS